MIMTMTKAQEKWGDYVNYLKERRFKVDSAWRFEEVAIILEEEVTDVSVWLSVNDEHWAEEFGYGRISIDEGALQEGSLMNYVENYFKDYMNPIEEELELFKLEFGREYPIPTDPIK